MMSIKEQANSYHQDFYAWTLQNAQSMRNGQLEEVDFINVAEEIESMGKRDRRQLVNRSAILLAHLLKWQFQPERRGNSLKHTIKDQRFDVLELVQDSPRLKNEIDKQLDYTYNKARNKAIKQTGLGQTSFPTQCPYSLAQILADDFLPTPES